MTLSLDSPAPLATPAFRADRAAALALRLLLAAFVLALCLGPFLLVLVISFGEKIEGASWDWGLSLSSYRRFFLGFEWPESLSLVYPQRLWFSVWYAALSALIAVVLAFPFTWALTRLSRRWQTAWLVLILSSLSLSEVFVVMGWDVLLSGRSGLPMLFRESGLTAWMKETGWLAILQDWDLANPRDVKFKPSGFATILALTYQVWPYAVVLLYPALSRLDPALMEAARTMGARPLTVMRTVVLPLVRLPLAGALLLLFVYNLGAYVSITVFAAPAQQTLTVTIYDSVRGSTLDAPFGAAQSVVLLLAAALCLMASARLARGGRA